MYNAVGDQPNIELSESLRKRAGKLYVYGYLAKRDMNMPGLPTIRAASGLALSGVPASNAWEIAHKLQSRNALIVLFSFENKSSITTRVEEAVQRLEKSGAALQHGPVAAIR